MKNSFIFTTKHLVIALMLTYIQQLMQENDILIMQFFSK